MIRQAIANVIQNAIDFSPAGASIVISARSISGRVEFSIQDRGPGVPDYALEQVFERFYSLSRPDNGRKGTGLGLTFVREVARLHGGDATLTNRAGGGAIATLALPLTPIDPQ